MANFKRFIILAIFMVQPLCAEAQVVNRVVAVVNDEVITQQDVDQLLGVLYAQYTHAYKGEELLKKMEEVKGDILNQMIEDKLVLSRAKELDIRIREEEINDKMESVKGEFPSEKDFYNMIEMQGITVANLKDRYRDQIMMRKLIDFEVKGRVAVLPSEIAAYYEGHRKEFKQNKKYKVRHILIKAEDDVGFELAMVEAQDIYKSIKAGGAFVEFANKYSQGPNKEDGGDMGYIEEGEMLEELDRVIFALNSGDVSEPVRSGLGYHIFKVEDIEASGYFSFKDAQAQIKDMLLQKKFKEKLREWLEELMSKAYISIK